MQFFRYFRINFIHIAIAMILRLISALALLLASAPFGIASSADSLSVMSFNIRYANPGDGAYLWPTRVDRVCEAIQDYAPDILGTQEVLHNQLVDMQQRLPGYTSVGVAREDGRTQGEYAALWFRNDRFILADSGNFWLSATPLEAGSLGWDGACVRIATWARLTDRLTGRDVLALNTHLDHVGPLARKLGARLVISTLDSIRSGRDIPVVVTGDFNSGPEDPVIIDITSADTPGFLTDSRLTAATLAGPEWTFQDFDRRPLEERDRIDYIFYRGAISPASYTTIDRRNAEGLYLSDHCPVYVVFSLTPEAR